MSTDTVPSDFKIDKVIRMFKSSDKNAINHKCASYFFPVSVHSMGSIMLFEVLMSISARCREYIYRRRFNYFEASLRKTLQNSTGQMPSYFIHRAVMLPENISRINGYILVVWKALDRRIIEDMSRDPVSLVSVDSITLRYPRHIPLSSPPFLLVMLWCFSRFHVLLSLNCQKLASSDECFMCRADRTSLNLVSQ